MNDIIWLKTLKEDVFPSLTQEEFEQTIELLSNYYDYGLTFRENLG